MKASCSQDPENVGSHWYSWSWPGRDVLELLKSHRNPTTAGVAYPSHLQKFKVRGKLIPHFMQKTVLRSKASLRPAGGLAFPAASLDWKALQGRVFSGNFSELFTRSFVCIHNGDSQQKSSLNVINMN